MIEESTVTEPTEGHDEAAQPTRPLAHEETPSEPGPAQDAPAQDIPAAHQTPAGPPPPTAQWAAGPTPEQVATKERNRRRLRTGVLFGGVALIGAIVGGVAVAAVDWATHVPNRGVAAQLQRPFPNGGHGQHGGHGGQGGQQGFRSVTGTVVSVQNTTITVTASNGQQVTETTTPQTVVRGSKTMLTDLKPGDHVTLRLNRNGQVQGILVQ